jgi:hypothetical protein
MSLETWKAWVTQQRQESLARKKLAHLIEETGYSYWPTPRAVDARSANQPHKDRGVKPIAHLNAAVKQENWPTPTTAEAGKIGNQANFGQTGLSNHPAIRGETERGKMLKSREGDGRSTQPGGPPDPDKNSTNGKSHGQSWTTPNANDHREATGMRPSRIETNRKTEYLHRQVNTTTAKLNPNWVEQLMGLPVGWTQLSTAWTGSD